MVDSIAPLAGPLPVAGGANGVVELPALPYAGDGSASPVRAATPADSSSLEAALQNVQQQYRSADVDVTFSIDQQADRVIVKIIDSKDGAVLRQLPSEEVLRLARALSGSNGVLLHETI